MSTGSLLHWVALVAGVELCARGHLFDRPDWLHAGAWLLAAALAVGAFSLRGGRPARVALLALALLPALLSASAWLDDGEASEPGDPLLAFWNAHPSERRLLDAGADAGAAAVELFGERIALGPRGARADEAASPAGARYRIVAAGGSSTFGATRGSDEASWPALLEAAIRRELSCAVPVEVVNTGVLGRGIAGVAKMFETEVLPLDPQLLIFEPDPGELDSLASELPPLRLAAPDPTPSRASQLLRGLEESWRRRAATSVWERARARPLPDLDPGTTTLAGAYRRLLFDARSEGIEVAIAGLSLAVAADGPEREIRRYEALEPRTRQRLLALELHRRVLLQLAATYRATLIDTTPDPGAARGELFLDLHLRSQRGRVQLAERLLEGLRAKLGEAPPGCTARPRTQSHPAATRAADAR